MSAILARFQAEVRSPLGGVSSRAWWKFAAALDVQSINAVSLSGGLGSYDIRPRRLVELGFAENLRYVPSDAGRSRHECDFRNQRVEWGGILTRERFLRDPVSQLEVLGRSMRDYQSALESGQLANPAKLSLAGALALLHRGGRGALADWPNLFESTRALYDAAQGIF